MRRILSGLLLSATFLCNGLEATAQYNRVAMNREYIISLTPQWKGERLPDGRPFVSDDLLERLK